MPHSSALLVATFLPLSSRLSPQESSLALLVGALFPWLANLIGSLPAPRLPRSPPSLATLLASFVQHYVQEEPFLHTTI